METTHTLDTINSQLLKAIDIILAYNKSEGLPVTSDSAMGKIITPTFPSIVKELRKKGRSVPHIGLVRFVAHFPYDMNYFYNKDLDFIYPSQKKEPSLAVKNVKDKLDNHLKDFFFNTPEVSSQDQEALLVLKDELVELYEAKSELAKNTCINKVLNTGIKIVAQGNVSVSTNIDIKENMSIDIKLSDIKTELINQQKDYKALSQKYVALLEKQLG